MAVAVPIECPALVVLAVAGADGRRLGCHGAAGDVRGGTVCSGSVGVEEGEQQSGQPQQTQRSGRSPGPRRPEGSPSRHHVVTLSGARDALSSGPVVDHANQRSRRAQSPERRPSNGHGRRPTAERGSRRGGDGGIRSLLGRAAPAEARRRHTSASTRRRPLGVAASPGDPLRALLPARAEPSVRLARRGAHRGASGQPRAPRSSLHACSQERQASAHTRQCSCMSAWEAHSSPHAWQAVAHAVRIARVMLAS
ncbi:hypothetical protein SUDANB105_00021 [Streptomyces sp. enrichment culture]